MHHSDALFPRVSGIGHTWPLDTLYNDSQHGLVSDPSLQFFILHAGMCT
jgi:hypothetical protein